MSSTHWWSSMSGLPRTSYSRRTFAIGLASKAFKLWCKSEFDLYFAYYPIDMSGTCTMGLTSMSSTYWWPLSRLSEFNSHFAYIPHFLVGLASSGLHRRRSRSDEQSHGWVILTRCSLINQKIWRALHHRIPPNDDHRHGWVILPHISLMLRHILLGLVSSDLPRRCSRSDEQSHDWMTFDS